MTSLTVCSSGAGSALRKSVGSDKTLAKLLGRTSDANIRFGDLCLLLERLGFDKRVRGSHHLFRMTGVEERINLQSDGTHAKPYQVRQVRAIVLKYKLGGQDDQI